MTKPEANAPAALWAPVELESERMRLVVPHPDHAKAVIEGIEESFEALHRWMEWATEVPELAAERAHLEAKRRSFVAGESLDYFLFRASGDRFLGACGFPRLDRENGVFEIGYWIRAGETGAGLAAEAVRCCTRLAFEVLGAERVEIRMSDLNRASRRVAERAGYRLESLIPNDTTHPDGSPRDTRVYALTRQRDFDAGGAGSRSEHDSK